MEILFAALAEAILSLLIEDLATKPKIAELRERWLRGDAPEKLAIERALKSAHTAFSRQYAELASSFFDDHLLRQPAVERELAKALTPNRTPDAAVLVKCWQVQFSDGFQGRLPDIEESAQFFLTRYQEEVTAQPALANFVNGRAFQELYQHTALLTDIRDGQTVLIDEVRRLNRQGETVDEQWVVIAQTTPQLPVRQQPLPARSQPTAYPANPFSDRGRINDPARFFGRHRILRDVQQALRAGNCISVVGDSQIGKSSLLYYLYTTRDQWYTGRRLVYLDLQSVSSEKDFCSEFLSLLGQKGKDLRAVRRALRNESVTLFLDEVEKLAQSDFTIHLRDLLRALAQEGNLLLLVASQRPLTIVFPPTGDTSPFHNLFMQQTLAGFSPQEARGFLAQRLSGTGVTFADMEVAELIAASGRHPARLQELAYAHYRSKTELE